MALSLMLWNSLCIVGLSILRELSATYLVRLLRNTYLLQVARGQNRC